MEHSSTGPSAGATSANTTSGCLLAIGRAVASLVLGVIVFVGMVYFVVLTGISGRLLDTDFYTSVLNDSDAYDRLYEVAAEEILEQSESSLVGIYMPDEEELSDLLRQIAPRSYVRSQAGKQHRTHPFVSERRCRWARPQDRDAGASGASASGTDRLHPRAHRRAGGK